MHINFCFSLSRWFQSMNLILEISLNEIKSHHDYKILRYKSNSIADRKFFTVPLKWTFLPRLILIDPVVSEKKIKNRQHTFWYLWASCFFQVQKCISNQQQKNITFLEDHPMNIPTIISSNLPTGFREEDKQTYNTLSNPCFFCAFPINKKHKLFIKPFKEHSIKLDAN